MLRLQIQPTIDEVLSKTLLNLTLHIHSATSHNCIFVGFTWDVTNQAHYQPKTIKDGKGFSKSLIHLLDGWGYSQNVCRTSNVERLRQTLGCHQEDSFSGLVLGARHCFNDWWNWYCKKTSTDGTPRPRRLWPWRKVDPSGRLPSQGSGQVGVGQVVESRNAHGTDSQRWSRRPELPLASGFPSQQSSSASLAAYCRIPRHLFLGDCGCSRLFYLTLRASSP